MGESLDISGKNVLVTGAATGIGRASALAFASAGAASVMIADIDEVNAAETERLVQEAGAACRFRPTDVSRTDELRALFAEASAVEGGLDIVHNNAGIVSGAADFVDQPLERIELVVRINYLAMLLGTRLAIDAMRGRGGAIVNTASIAALGPMPTDPPYSSTKAAVVNFTQALAGLRESHGIRVNAVLPGMVDTPILAKTGDGEPAPWLAGILPAMKLLQPEDIAEAVIGMVQDDAKAGDAMVVGNEGSGG